MDQNNSLIETVRPQESLENERTDNHSSPSFITSNTVASSIEEIKNNHIIPVFTKDNETLISHTDFVEAALGVLSKAYSGEAIAIPQIRLSHPIKGRVPEAKDKPASQLEEWEKTIYYERMMFIIEIPGVRDTIDGNTLSLTIGGVKAYSQDNLYSRSLCDQHFKFFIGFQNKVCTNLCVWTDGYMGDIKVKNLGQLSASMRTLIESYNENFHIFHLKKLAELSISEQQFAQIVGRCRMYNYLPAELKREIPHLMFGDQQMSTVVKEFYNSHSPWRNQTGDINLWKLYNLFTGANKSSYIDSFLERSINAFNLTEQIRLALEQKENCWYLN